MFVRYLSRRLTSSNHSILPSGHISFVPCYGSVLLSLLVGRLNRDYCLHLVTLGFVTIIRHKSLQVRYSIKCTECQILLHRLLLLLHSGGPSSFVSTIHFFPVGLQISASSPKIDPPRLHLCYPPPPPPLAPSHQWQRQEGGSQAQTTINLGSGGRAVALAGQWRRDARTAALLGREGGGGHAAVLVGRRRGVHGGERCRRRWVCRCVVGAAAALSGREGSGGRGPTGKGSDNQHVVGGCVWQGAGVGGARRSSWPPLETTSLAPAEAPRRCSFQGWRLSCGGEEEVASTKATMMAAGMSSS
jgi:hypothetical protein